MTGDKRTPSPIVVHPYAGERCHYCDATATEPIGVCDEHAKERMGQVTPASRPLEIGDRVREAHVGKIVGWTGAATAPGARWADVLWEGSDQERHHDVVLHESEMVRADHPTEHPLDLDEVQRTVRSVANYIAKEWRAWPLPGEPDKLTAQLREEAAMASELLRDRLVSVFDNHRMKHAPGPGLDDKTAARHLYFSSLSYIGAGYPREIPIDDDWYLRITPYNAKLEPRTSETVQPKAQDAVQLAEAIWERLCHSSLDGLDARDAIVDVIRGFTIEPRTSDVKR
jgi:hypothetical protein